jgi:DNA-binding MarR family transcriptional regulator
MPADHLYEAKEPLVRCLNETLAVWETTLDRALSQSGVSLKEWRLLGYLASGERLGPAPNDASHPVPRGASATPEPWLSAAEFEAMIERLEGEGWVVREDADQRVRPVPVIPQAASRRMERVCQSIKALQSVWVSALSPEERGTMITYLSRMQRQLDAYATRQTPCEDVAPQAGPELRLVSNGPGT